MDRPESLIQTDLLLETLFWATDDKIIDTIIAKQKYITELTPDTGG